MNERSLILMVYGSMVFLQSRIEIGGNLELIKVKNGFFLGAVT